MNKLKNLYCALKENVFLKYPVTMVVIWIAAIFAAVIVDLPYDYEYSDLLCEITCFFFLFATGNLFTEEFLGKKKTLLRILGFVCSAVIAFAVSHILWLKEDTIFGIEQEICSEYTVKFLVCYLAWIATLCIWKMYKNSAESFEKYCISVFGSVMRTSIVYGLFSLGLVTIFVIIDELLFDTNDFLIRIQVLLFCGLYIPGMILAFSKVKEDIGKFLRGVVKYVLLILTMAAFVVIYIYIFKIIILWNLPSNEVFPILSRLFACGLPIWTAAMYFKEDKFGKIAGLLPYAFIPFLILQCICIGLRIREYGLTDLRYAACFLIVAEVIYLILFSIKKRGYVPLIFFVAAGLLTVYMFAPVLNCDSMVYFSHTSRFEKLMEKAESGNELSKKEIQKVLGAYEALRSLPEGKRYLHKISDSQKFWIDVYKDMNIYSGDLRDVLSMFMRWSILEYGLDVGDYQKLYEIRAVQQGSYDEPVDCTNIEYEVADQTYTIDVSDFVKKIRDEYDVIKEEDSHYWHYWLMKNGKFHLDNGADLYVNYINVDFEDDVCTDFEMCAYYLE